VCFSLGVLNDAFRRKSWRIFEKVRCARSTEIVSLLYPARLKIRQKKVKFGNVAVG
jgi:hypothetical protein